MTAITEGRERTFHFCLLNACRMPNKIASALVYSLVVLSVVWSESGCSDEKAATSDETSADSVWVAKGQTIVAATFSALSTALQQALERGGPSEAVTYCHLAALPITDSLSKVYHAHIRRTSDKFRNPNNRPNDRERELIESYHQALAQGTPLQPYVEHIGQDSIWYAAPIRVAPLCLQCHGMPGQDIADETLRLLKQHYPNDTAIGYSEGDFRGIWSITFVKN